ncbi:alanine--glyoxylate aminotransferase family protein [Enterococcus dongliensis]|uniref:pyridoxal-phosphate-dependent aminotransferase family protein n=1 Tax=Enterococcus dongliensis TaxID=2559925 RepID=UPI002892665B|nr:alanine--glyoxylate aminotransferase family protein [Enterococcus dongliensis]MDT2640831.1 alanine--glyoxylate aminotransferase family protein [Enterococcus dongliensis]
MEKDVLVMIPGPTPVVRSIQNEMAREVQAFGDPRFVSDYKNLIDDLAMLFNCSGKTFPLAGSGTLAMEMAIANVTKPGDNVLIVSNGYFGDRFVEICERRKLNVDVLVAKWGTVITPDEINAQLAKKDYAAMTVSHVDTSTAVVAPIAEIGQVIKNYPRTVYIVDGVAATGAEYVDVDGMNIDIMFTGSQKAFGVSPGMFVLWAGTKALERRKALGLIPDYYIDFEKWIPIMDDPAKYFATPAVNLVWAMKEATAIIKQEGLLERHKRHQENAIAVRAALCSIGCEILAVQGNQASSLSNVIYPSGINDTEFRAAMYENGVIVASALGDYAGKAFRVGHMGNITEQNMIQVLATLEKSFIQCGLAVKPGSVVGRYMEEMQKISQLA